MLKKVEIYVPENEVNWLVGIVSVLLKHSNEDPYINNNILIDNVKVNVKETIDNETSYLTNINNNKIDIDKLLKYNDYYEPKYEEVVAYIEHNGWLDEFDSNSFFHQLNNANWTIKGQKVRKWTKLVDLFHKNGWCIGKTTIEKMPELPLTVIKP